MARIIGGILCDEIVDGYDESADQKGVGSKKGYLCNWDDRFIVAQALLGLSSSAGVGGAINILRPLAHPQLFNCYCTAVGFEGKGRPFQGPYQQAWPKCIVWATYGTLEYNWGPWQMNLDPATPFLYAAQEIDVGVEVLTIPGRFLKFAGGTTLLRDAFARRIALVEMKITLHRVPYLPGQKILATAGGINNATYLGVAAGQLLFNGAHNQGQLLSDGTYTQDITYSFSAREFPWDYSYNGKANAWQKVVRIDGSDFFVRGFLGLFPDEYV